MCFSAGSSFTAAGLLGLATIATMQQTRSRKMLLFTMIPLLFAIQQAAEGMVWLTFSCSALADARLFFSYIFLTFAYIVWPIWIPTSLYLYLSDRRMLFSLAAGVITSFLLGFVLFYYKTSIAVVDHHIQYITHAPRLIWIPSGVLYLLATVVPFFLVNNKKFWIFGIVLSLSYIISGLFYYTAFVSIWCFFAALLSVLVYMVIT